MESAFKSKEQEEKEKRRRRKQKKKEEMSPRISAKKEAIQKDTTKGFEEVQPIVDIKFVPTQVLGAEKGVTVNELIIRQDIAIKLAKEEKRKRRLETKERKIEKEKEKIENTPEKTEKEPKRVDRVAKRIEKETKKIEKEAKQTERETKQIEREHKLIEREMKRTKKSEELIEKIEEKTKPISKRKKIERERSKQIHKLLKKTRYRGMKDPIVELAAKLVRQEIKKGLNPKLAIRKVIILLGKLKIIKKSNLKEVFTSLRKLIGLG